MTAALPLRPRPADTLAGQLLETGFVLLRHAAPQALIDAVHDDLAADLAASPADPRRGGVASLGGLLTRSPWLAVLMTDPAVLAAAHVLTHWHPGIRIDQARAFSAPFGAAVPSAELVPDTSTPAPGEHRVTVIWPLTPLGGNQAPLDIWPRVMGSGATAAPRRMVLNPQDALVLLDGTRCRQSVNLSASCSRMVAISYIAAGARPREAMALTPAARRMLPPALLPLVNPADPWGPDEDRNRIERYLASNSFG